MGYAVKTGLIVAFLLSIASASATEWVTLLEDDFADSSFDTSLWNTYYVDAGGTSYEGASGLTVEMGSGYAHSGSSVYSNASWWPVGNISLSFNFSKNDGANTKAGDTGVWFCGSRGYSGLDRRDTAYYGGMTGDCLFINLDKGCGAYENTGIYADDGSTSWHCGWEEYYHNSTAFLVDGAWYNATIMIDSDTGDVAVYIDDILHRAATINALRLNQIFKQRLSTGFRIELHDGGYPYNTNKQNVTFKDLVLKQEAPSCTETNVSTDTTLSLNVEGKCYNIIADDVTFNCNGKTVTGYNETLAVAFDIMDVDNIEVKNCPVKGFLNAFRVDNVHNVTLHNNTFYDANKTIIIAESISIINFYNSTSINFTNNTLDNITMTGTDTSTCYGHTYTMLNITSSNDTVITGNTWGDNNYLYEYRDQVGDIPGCQGGFSYLGKLIQLTSSNHTSFAGANIQSTTMTFYTDSIDCYYTSISEAYVNNQYLSVSSKNSTFTDSIFNNSILVAGGTYATLSNLTISGDGTSTTIRLYVDEDYATISDIIIYCNGSASGISMIGADYSQVSNVLLEDCKGTGTGGALNVQSADVNIWNVTVKRANYSNSYSGGIRIIGDRVNVSDSIVQDQIDGSGFSMYLDEGGRYKNITIQNVTTDYDFYNVASTNSTIIDGNFNMSRLVWVIAGTGYYTFVAYTHTVNVTDGTNPIEGANVSWYNVSSTYVDSQATDSNGQVEFELVEFKQWGDAPYDGACSNETYRECYTPYTINATNGTSTNETTSQANQTQQFLLILYGGAEADPCQPTGNWDVTSNLVCTLYNIILSGYNVTITNGANLYLNNSNLTASNININEGSIGVFGGIIAYTS